MLRVGNLDAQRDITDVRDTVRAYQALAERGQPRRPVQRLQRPARYSMRRLLDILLSLARVRVRVAVDPARLRPSDNPVILGSHARLTADTGWTPVIPIEQTLADLLDYWRRASARMSQPAATAHSETARQLVHMAMGAFALLLRWLPWWQAVALAAAALAFNLFVLPRARARTSIGPAIASAACTASSGIRSPCCCCSSPSRAVPTSSRRRGASSRSATAWRRWPGRAIGGPRWPWNREKTLSGSAAFAIGGAAAGVFLAWWCRPALAPPPSLAFTIAAPIVAAIAAALVETMPVRLDDNLSVAATAGGVHVAGVAGRRSRTCPARDGPGRRRACRPRSR